MDTASTKKALNDMKDAIRELAKQIHIDFYACYGDILYRLTASPDYEKGKQEAIAATKLLNDAFGNNQQIRMVGNHDPNAFDQTHYFSKEYLNSLTGIYSDFVRNETFPYGAYGFRDLERQKVRLIFLNTSFYSSSASGSMYAFGDNQSLWLCQTLDMSSKEHPEEWQIMIFSHVSLDSTAHPATLGKRTNIIKAYLDGSTADINSELSYNFAGKNTAKLALYTCGHAHCYMVRNLRYVLKSGDVVENLPLSMVYVPNALNGRDEESFDGRTYSKTADTAESTAFQVITLDAENEKAYFHHYGAGIDIILHYAPLTISAVEPLTTALASPAWTSRDSHIATVSDGIVTAISNGSTVVYAQGTDGTVEAWNIKVQM